MNKEFMPYEQALALKELGFDDPCFAWFILEGDGAKSTFVLKKCPKQDIGLCLAPLYQQAFKWFREKYGLFTHIEKGENPKNFYPIIDNVSHKYNPKLWFDFYEEAELECLKKLIEIVKSK